MPVATSNLGVGVAVAVAEEIVQNPAKISAQADTRAIPLRIVSQEMGLVSSQAERSELGGQVIDVRFRQQRPMLADVAAQRLGVGEKELLEGDLLLGLGPDAEFLQNRVIGFRPAETRARGCWGVGWLDGVCCVHSFWGLTQSHDPNGKRCDG